MRNKTTAIVLTLLFGWMGGQRFYLGQPGAGVVSLFFCWTGVPLVLALIELLILATMDDARFNAKYNHQVAPQYVTPQRAGVPVLSEKEIAAQLSALRELNTAGVLSPAEYAEQQYRLNLAARRIAAH